MNNIFGFNFNGVMFIGEVGSYYCGKLEEFPFTKGNDLDTLIREAVYVKVKKPLQLIFNGKDIGTIPYAYNFDSGEVVFPTNDLAMFNLNAETINTYLSQTSGIDLSASKIVV